jgi:hypothetical protein
MIGSQMAVRSAGYLFLSERRVDPRTIVQLEGIGQGQILSCDRPALEPTQPPIQWVKRPERETDFFLLT